METRNLTLFSLFRCTRALGEVKQKDFLLGEGNTRKPILTVNSTLLTYERQKFLIGYSAVVSVRIVELRAACRVLGRTLHGTVAVEFENCLDLFKA